MIGASITYKEEQLLLLGFGEYWQSDGYETSFSNQQTKLISRRIMKKIAAHDKFFRTRLIKYAATVAFNQPLDNSQYIQISSDWIGLWLVLEYSIKDDITFYHLRKDKF